MDTQNTENKTELDPLELKRIQVKAKQAQIREDWRNNLFWFNRECLRVEDGEKKVKLNTFHEELCNFVDNRPDKQKLILVPRGHLKSTIITIGKVLQWIARDPSVRILIANATYNNAISFLNVIKRHLQMNELFIEMFGPMAENPERWAENMITLNQAKMVGGGEKEATVVCYGIGGNLVSQHYDKIILDDVVNEDTVNTRDQIEKTINFYKLCQPLLEKGGEMIIIGTKWREDDLYGWIEDKENGIIQDMLVYKRQAITDEVFDNTKRRFVQGQVLWPEKYDLNDFSEKYRLMGPYVFSAQYQNIAVAPSDADFKREWFIGYEPTDIKGLEMNKYVLIDPAISDESYADYTAFVTVGVDKYSNIYILDLLRDRIKPDQVIAEIFRHYEKWHPQAIGIEEVGFQRTLRYSLQKEMESRKRFINMIELKPHARNKNQRIKGLQPLYANGKVLHNKELIYNMYLEDELLRFPKGKHDDLIDALSYALDLIHPPAQRATEDRKRKHYLYGK